MVPFFIVEKIILVLFIVVKMLVFINVKRFMICCCCCCCWLFYCLLVWLLRCCVCAAVWIIFLDAATLFLYSNSQRSIMDCWQPNFRNHDDVDVLLRFFLHSVKNSDWLLRPIEWEFWLTLINSIELLSRIVPIECIL